MSKLDRLDPATLKDNPRASFDAWRCYGSIVAGARLVFPKPYEVQLLNRSTATAASRLRDAIRGAIVFNYTNDTTGLKDWYSKVHITHSSTHLIIRPADMPKTTTAVQAVLSDEFPYSFDTLASDELEAFALLLSRGRILGPVHVKHFDKRNNGLPVWPNVECIPRPDNSLILL